jgi:hypothetical protein
MVLKPDVGSDKFDTSDVSDLGSDISDRKTVAQYWNPMEISDLVGFVR